MVLGSTIVRVVYHTHYQVESPSHVLCFVGSSPYLGEWRPELALALNQDDVAGWWSGEVAIPPGESFEWKLFVRDSITGHVIREEERETRYLNILSGNIMFHVFAYWNYHELFANVYGDCAESWAFPDVRHRYTKRPEGSMATSTSVFGVKVMHLAQSHAAIAQGMGASCADITEIPAAETCTMAQPNDEIAQAIDANVADITHIPEVKDNTLDSDLLTDGFFFPSTKQGQGQSRWHLPQIKLPWFGEQIRQRVFGKGSNVDSLSPADVDDSQISRGAAVAMVTSAGVVGLVHTGLYLKRRL